MIGLADFWATYSTLVFSVGVHMLLALSIWLTLSCGLLSLANAAFMGIGAYVSALLTLNADWSFPAVLAVGGIAPALVALLIGAPVLRLSGVYLAMATLAFGEVVRITVLNLDITGGPEGLNGIPLATEGWHIALLLALTVYGLTRLRRSRIGRAFEAIKEDEVAARLMGIPVDRYKLLAFALGGFIAGIAGALNAHFTFFISPREYGFEAAVDILTMAVLGGTGSLLGPLLGAGILTLLPELLRSLHDFRSLVNGAVLVLVVLFLPKGIVGGVRRKTLGAKLSTKLDQSAGKAEQNAAREAQQSNTAISSTPLLSIRHLGKHFGGLHVLHDVSFNVPAGSIYGLIGPNGAGKTTVFNLVTGLLLPSAGQIDFQEQSLVGKAPHAITCQGVARTFQNIRLFKEMTILENVMVGMHAHLSYGAPALLLNTSTFRQAEQQARQRAYELLTWVDLHAKADQVADNLSYGDQRKLEFARALATEPRLLLLDEPVAGMNPAEKTALMAEIRAIRDRGYSVFMIEHDMRFVMGLCDRIAVLNFGRIIAEGTPEEIRNNPEVIEAYLGKEDAI
ncbi:MAG TPA: branched-chain amino acid ABC transporter ATP-binding protein/permease [Rhodocyclaceae bacterium]|jgi:ABC-type branched-subunit amino acid transport system ATPase component/ABC-type branched-subunit amino acid transport system permease subunit|nr:branched-chain amino acid ABC transporter ATP-binding protein/permease [Rhodocyclaceae bacterium]